MRSNWMKLTTLIAGIAGIALALRALGLSWSDYSPERVRSYVLSFGWWAPVAYVLLCAQPFIPIPASIMWMAGGLSFGLVGGFLITWLASVLRGCGQFLIARVLGREAVAAILKGRLAALDQHLGRDGFQTVLWVRLVPNLPYDLQNFGFGFSGVSFGAFTAATLLGVMPGIFLWVYIGCTLTDFSQLWTIIVPVIGLAALWWAQLRSRHRRARVPS